MTLSPSRIVLVLLFVFIGVFGAAFAISGALIALPAPAAGGTCGPSTASESALAALTNPASIGAGTAPPVSNAAAHAQWQAFVDQCQSAADQRGLAAGGLLIVSLAIAIVGPLWVLRRARSRGAGPASGSHGVPGGPVGGWSQSPPMWNATDLVGQGGIGTGDQGILRGT